MKYSCFWRHDWDKWKKLSRGTINQPDFYSGEIGAQKTVGHWVLQERRCLRCGKIEIDEQETY